MIRTKIIGFPGLITPEEASEGRIAKLGEYFRRNFPNVDHQLVTNNGIYREGNNIVADFTLSAPTWYFRAAGIGDYKGRTGVIASSFGAAILTSILQDREGGFSPNWYLAISPFTGPREECRLALEDSNGLFDISSDFDKERDISRFVGPTLKKDIVELDSTADLNYFERRSLGSKRIDSLVLIGAEDKTVDLNSVRKYQKILAKLGNSRLIEIPGVGHNIPYEIILENAEEFVGSKLN